MTMATPTVPLKMLSEETGHTCSSSCTCSRTTSRSGTYSMGIVTVMFKKDFKRQIFEKKKENGVMRAGLRSAKSRFKNLGR